MENAWLDPNIQRRNSLTWDKEEKKKKKKMKHLKLSKYLFEVQLE